MLWDILLTLPILLLVLMTAVRCLDAWGLALPGPGWAEPSGAGGPDVPERRELLKVFALGLLFRLFMLLVMVLCSMLAGGDNGLHGLPGQFARWDAAHYINLIDRGYTGYVEEGQHLFLVFYPLYVWAARAVRMVVPNTIIAGLLVSSLSYAWGCCYVYRIAAKLLGRQGARDSVVLLSLFPFSFFFGTVMTEGLFLLTTSAACCYAMERRWLLYGLWGALAALTRMTGVLVIIPAAVELLGELRPFERPIAQSLKRSVVGFIKRLPALLMPFLGSAGYLALNWYVDGDPFAFRAHQAHWFQGGMWISRVLRYLWDYFQANIASADGYAIWLPELVLFVLAFAVIFLAVDRREARPGLMVYALCYLIANYSLSWLLSAGRYMSCCFPMFIFAAMLIKDRPRLRLGVFAAQGVLLGVYFYAYLGGAQVM